MIIKNRNRIKDAIEIAIRFGQIDGAHHKGWVIDQMVRALCGCTLGKGGYIENEEYLEIIRTARDGEDGPDTYDWDVGIAP